MNKMLFLVMFAAMTMLSTSCSDEIQTYQCGDLSVQVEEGDGWLHDYPLFLGLKKKNAPQIAIWLEDTSGQYMTTLYASKKIATQGWKGAGGNRRKEALPHWCYSRGVRYEDGCYAPTKGQPLVDAMTGATPRGSFDVRLVPQTEMRQFRVKVEVNHSVDFNDRYSDDLQLSHPDYSGGKEGSGQPALVYLAHIDLDSGNRSFPATLVGHSSPSGEDGELYTDMSGLTSALTIVKQITVCVK